MNDIPLDAATAPASEPMFSPAPAPANHTGNFGDHLRRAGSKAPGKPAAAAGETVVDETTATLKSTRRKTSRARRIVDQPSHKADETAAGAVGHPAHQTPDKTSNPPKLEMANAFPTAQAEAVQSVQPQNAIIFPVANVSAETANPGESPLSETGLPSILPAAVELIDLESLPRAIAPESVETDRPAGNRTIDLPLAIAAAALEMKTSAEHQPSEEPGTTGGPRPGKAGQAAVELADALSRMLGARIAEANAAAPLASLEASPATDETSQPAAIEGTPGTLVSSDGAAARNANMAGPNAVEPPRPRSIGAGLGGTASSHQTSANQDPQLEVDRIRFLQRVSRAFQSLGTGEGHVRLRLSPPSLGALTLEVALRGSELVARFETETAAAKYLLLDNLPALRERLLQHEIRIARFDVDLADHTGGGGGGEHASPDARPHRDNRPRRQGDQTLTTATTPTRRPLTHASQANLDVII